MPNTSISILWNVTNENEFQLLHSRLLRMRANPKRTNNSSSSTNVDQTTNTANQNSRENQSNSLMIIHYTHEQRLAKYTKVAHQIWHNTFMNTPTQSTRLIIGTRNNRNNTRELVQKNQANIPNKYRHIPLKWTHQLIPIYFSSL